MAPNRKSKGQIQAEQREAEHAARLQNLVSSDFSAADSFEALYGDCSVDEIKYLTQNNASFKAVIERLDRQPLPQTTTLSQSADETNALRDSERIAAENAQYAADRGAAELSVEVQPNREPAEKLYEGVEQLGPNRYRLTIDPEDGTPKEVFYSDSQAGCWKKLRDSKKNATRELRRRAKQVQITDEELALKPEIVNYPPLVEPLKLTPDEIWQLTEDTKNAVTVLEATRKLRLASITQEEADRQNEAILHNRYQEAFNVASAWIGSHSEFYPCQENVNALRELISRLNWACTSRNLDLAFSVLQKQGVLVERPANETTEPDPLAAMAPANVQVQAQAPAQPAPPQPRAAAPVKVLRPATSTTFVNPRRIETAPTKKTFTLTPAEYHKTPASEVQRRYKSDNVYRQAVDDLMSAGKI